MAKKTKQNRKFGKSSRRKNTRRHRFKSNSLKGIATKIYNNKGKLAAGALGAYTLYKTAPFLGDVTGGALEYGIEDMMWSRAARRKDDNEFYKKIENDLYQKHNRVMRVNAKNVDQATQLLNELNSQK
jgi:hypothetical protein